MPISALVAENSAVAIDNVTGGDQHATSVRNLGPSRIALVNSGVHVYLLGAGADWSQ